MAISNLSHRLWLLPPRVRGGFVCPNCWLALGVGIGLLALVAVVLFARWLRFSKLLVSVWGWYWSFGAGFGRSARAAVSFHLSLWSAPSVGIPRRNLAKKCGVRVVN